MDYQFVYNTTRYMAIRNCWFTPAVAARVDHGFALFRFRGDYLTWRKQR